MSKNKHEKTPIYKKWWLYLIILIVIVLFVLFFPTNLGESGISLEEFDLIDLGMTQFEVNDLIDSNNTWNNDAIYNSACIEISKSEKDSIYTTQYKYMGSKSGYCLITYEVDYSDGFYGLKYPVVVYKENHNLK